MGEGIVFLVDDDKPVLHGMKRLCESVGHEVRTFSDAESFLEAYRGEAGCLILDVRMPGMGGLALQDRLIAGGHDIPIVFITGHGDVPMASKTLRKGALDFLEKPFRENILLERIEQGLASDQKRRSLVAHADELRSHLAKLTDREGQVMRLLVDGRTVKEIGLELELSHKTVHVHRAKILEKTGARTVVDLTRIALRARSET